MSTTIQQTLPTIQTPQHVLDKRIARQFKIWRLSTPFLYDVVATHTLKTPSLSVQWFPRRLIPKTEEFSFGTVVQDLLVGGDNVVSVLEVATPPKSDMRSQDESFIANSKVSVKVVKEIDHPSKVHRVRFMPQDNNIVATMSPDIVVNLLNLTGVQKSEEGAKDHLMGGLEGHEKQGWGLSWSPFKPGYLISGSDDYNVCMWDVKSILDEGRDPVPLRVLKAHSESVDSVEWSFLDENLFASVSDDKTLCVWDIRQEDPTKPSRRVFAHGEEVNSVSWNHKNANYLATGSTDSQIRLWDSRSLKSPVHTMESHKQAVYHVSFSPFSENVLASAGQDRRVMIWDLERTGIEQTVEDAEEGPPELLFIHGGHTSAVSEVQWSLQHEWTMGSVAEDSIFQVWEMSSCLHDEDVSSANSPATKKRKLNGSS